MNDVMDDQETQPDALNEVNKLKDLVQKLEKQNELLRSKQKLHLDPLQNGDRTAHNHISKSKIDDENAKDTCIQTLDDVDLLDIGGSSLEDEEDSWLYTSPTKSPNSVQTHVSPYVYVRQDLDRTGLPRDIDTAKRSLIHTLDEVARLGRSPSSPSLSSYRHQHGDRSSSGGRSSPSSKMTSSAPSPSNHSAATSSSSAQQPRQRPVMKQQLGGGSRIDTATFTRPKKKPAPMSAPRPQVIEPPNHHYDEPSSRLAPREEGHPRVGLTREETFRVPPNREDVPYKVPDVSDIQNLAKLQEESLRQSMASPYASPKKSLRTKHSSSSDADFVGSPGGSNRSSPGRVNSEGNLQYQRRPSNGVMSNGSQDSINSPPDSPYSSQYLQIHNNNHPAYNHSENTRRSLPNLAKNCTMPMRLNVSNPSLDGDSPDENENSYRAGSRSPVTIQQPVFYSRPKSPSIGALKQPNMIKRAMSPNRSGIPQPLRVARPSSAKSSLPMPVSRSMIPAPKTNGWMKPSGAYDEEYGVQGDESWKDGCF